MTNGQKIVKYFAFFLAIVIIASVIGGIASGIFSFFNIFNVSREDKNSYIYTEEVIDNIEKLEIDLNLSDLKIIKGEVFSIETNNKNIKYELKNNKIILKESKGFNINSNKVLITVPEDKIFNNVDISIGAGNINASDFSTLKLDVEGGAGNITFDNLSVTEKLEIDGGAGNITISNSQVNNMDLDNGVGEFIFEGILFGNTEVDMGLGNVTLNLNTNLDLYNIEIDKGIGNIIINNEKVKGDYNNKNIQNTKSIKIDGGVGNITINKVTVNSEAR